MTRFPTKFAHSLMCARMALNYQSDPSKTSKKRRRVSYSTETSHREDPFDQTLSLSTASNFKSNLSPQCLRPLTAPAHIASKWPEGIGIVEKTHRALNIVFTFCRTRQHVVTTFDNIKSAVESHLGKPLTIEAVAAVAAVRPDTIRFAYVNELALPNYSKGLERDVTFKTATPGDITSRGPPTDVSVGALTGLGNHGEPYPSSPDCHDGEVLYFEFVDGDVKPQSSKKTTGSGSKGSMSSSRNKTFKLPRYSKSGMFPLIDRRNKKFCDSLNAFVDECLKSLVDPVEKLREKTKKYIPTPSVPLTRREAATIPDVIPATRERIQDIILDLKSCPWYTGQIVAGGHRVFEPQPAVHGDLTFRLSQDLVNALYNSRGIIQFYAHQAEALNHLASGNNVVVATSTSSGKSLIYQLPVLHALEQDHSTRAMYIFPTKALAQDQKKSMAEVLCYMPQLSDVLVATFDGDTPWPDRATVRNDARIIFTNPDMLHLAILPNEEKWRKYLRHLKYVVGRSWPSTQSRCWVDNQTVDEIHSYDGQLGAHMAFIMRRLRRICTALGNNTVQFVSCSATIANPVGHFQTIFGIDEVSLVDFDGSPTGTVVSHVPSHSNNH